MYPELSDSQIEEVSEAVLQFENVAISRSDRETRDVRAIPEMV
jgi:hypothetical protein